MPLLAQAQAVGVFAADEAKHPSEAAELIAYLDWQGITAERLAVDPITDWLVPTARRRRKAPQPG